MMNHILIARLNKSGARLNASGRVAREMTKSRVELLMAAGIVGAKMISDIRDRQFERTADQQTHHQSIIHGCFCTDLFKQ